MQLREWSTALLLIPWLEELVGKMQMTWSQSFYVPAYVHELKYHWGDGENWASFQWNSWPWKYHSFDTEVWGL